MSDTINSTSETSSHIPMNRVPSETPVPPCSNATSCSIEAITADQEDVVVKEFDPDYTAQSGQDELWVFGYGSLVWKVDFPIAASQKGFIRGFQRRFYQNSIDHRGTSDKPGRVVTLIPAENDDDAKVYGVAHLIPNDKQDEVIQHLDHREKNGYSRNIVDFYPYPVVRDASGNATRKRICIYVATVENESYAGPKPLPELAEQVINARGISGANDEYVFRLAEAMRTLFPGVQDDHLFGLESDLLRLKCLRQSKINEMN